MKKAPVINVTDFPIGKSVRQGDVILQRTLDTVFTEPNANVLSNILQIGSRGAHVVSKEASIVQVNAATYVVSSFTFTLQHPEHADLILPAGTYSVATQREVDLVTRKPRRVVD